jgi:CelD/BcsL family acetyltransferase involved in cellulose biosynthesis
MTAMFSRKTAKAVLGPAVRAAWPAVEALGALSAPRRDLAVRWKSVWDNECDAALAALPAPAGATRALYRELTQGGGKAKRHALVRLAGRPAALISLRRRRVFWEPAAYQCLPGFIAPAIDDVVLGRALNALGVEVRVSSGLTHSPAKLNARRTHEYEVYQADLTGDYAAYWRKRNQKHLWAVRRARERCVDTEHRIDGEGDLAWIVNLWRENWERDIEREVVAADDRLRFWSALAGAPHAEGQWRVHTVQLMQGGQRVAGAVLLSRGDLITFQCTARDPAFESLSAGTRILDVSMEWAAANGFRCFDLGSGDYKKRWAPVGVMRHAAIFRPPLTDMLYRVDPI